MQVLNIYEEMYHYHKNRQEMKKKEEKDIIENLT